jgi:hypothetical protein
MTLIVEDGTGLANANGFVSIATVDAYFTERNAANFALWDAIADGTQAELIVTASTYLQNTYGTRWNGRRLAQTQSMDFPRIEIEDLDRFHVDSNSVPVAIEQATAELALKANTETLMPDITSPGVINRISQAVGSLKQDISYQGGRSQIKKFRLVDSLLLAAGLIDPPGTVYRA